MSLSEYGPAQGMIAQTERELFLQEFERKQRRGLLIDEPLSPGLRAWVAARMVSLPLLLDRRAGERAAEQLSLRHA